MGGTPQPPIGPPTGRGRVPGERVAFEVAGSGAPVPRWWLRGSPGVGGRGSPTRSAHPPGDRCGSCGRTVPVRPRTGRRARPPVEARRSHRHGPAATPSASSGPPTGALRLRRDPHHRPPEAPMDATTPTPRPPRLSPRLSRRPAATTPQSCASWSPPGWPARSPSPAGEAPRGPGGASPPPGPPATLPRPLHPHAAVRIGIKPTNLRPPVPRRR